MDAPSTTPTPLWRDVPALALIGGGGVSVVGLMLYIGAIFPQLPAEIALRFDALGQPDRYGPPSGLYLLPIIGAVTWVLNTAAGAWLHRQAKERPGAYMLFAATVIVQVFVWIAVLGIVTAGK